MVLEKNVQVKQLFIFTANRVELCKAQNNLVPYHSQLLFLSWTGANMKIINFLEPLQLGHFFCVELPAQGSFIN